ncbi:hypothetical protein ACHAW5_000335 [Stephanodiscus triporus]|uniref:Uncharacterized protein n=1 Tax=Stephanodiscus triporus TaxID=2934178 RepID=A0ABD3NPM2_9STRA
MRFFFSPENVNGSLFHSYFSFFVFGGHLHRSSRDLDLGFELGFDLDDDELDVDDDDDDDEDADFDNFDDEEE